MLTSTNLSRRILRSSVTQISPSRAGSTNNWFPRQPGQKRIKVEDHIVWLNFMPLDGQPRRVPAWPDKTLLTVMQDYKIPFLGSKSKQALADLCDGGDISFPSHQVPVDWYSEGPACGQCQVIIPKEWNDKIYFGEKERECIQDKATDPCTTSRLACCISLRPNMNEMVVYSAENNEESFY